MRRHLADTFHRCTGSQDEAIRTGFRNCSLLTPLLLPLLLPFLVEEEEEELLSLPPLHKPRDER